jgi:hypothetical protein
VEVARAAPEARTRAVLAQRRIACGAWYAVRQAGAAGVEVSRALGAASVAGEVARGAGEAGGLTGRPQSGGALRALITCRGRGAEGFLGAGQAGSAFLCADKARVARGALQLGRERARVGASRAWLAGCLIQFRAVRVGRAFLANTLARRVTRQAGARGCSCAVQGARTGGAGSA